MLKGSFHNLGMFKIYKLLCIVNISEVSVYIKDNEIRKMSKRKNIKKIHIKIPCF